MADLGITHILVAREADCSSVSLELEEDRRLSKQAIEVRGVRQIESVSVKTFGTAAKKTDTVENHEQKLSRNALEISVCVELEVRHCLSTMT